MFKRETFYTRRQINAHVGGSLISYLPIADGRVVAACLRIDTNPDAPNIILPGTGQGIEGAARCLVAQHSAVPVFIRRGPYRWEYVGDYVVKRWSHDAAEIDAQQVHSGRSRSGRERITSIIQMAARTD
jgi:hypothetical protein